MAQECVLELAGLVLLFLALLMSMSLNVFLSIRRRASLCRDKDDCCYPHNFEGEGPSQEEGRYFHEHNHHMQQDNPIYGNISTDRPEICYEMMNMQQTRNHLKPLETDLNYASLDLKLAKKRKRKYQRQDQLQAHLTPTTNSFLEVDRDMDANLPPRDTSTMVSHSSIYLNSQQIAQETEEMGRERSMNREWEDVGWGGIEKQEDGGTTELRGEQESERGAVGNGTVCIQGTKRDSDNFTSSYCQGSE
ncbi:uncharacterized protein [Paralichthys olivaceus]|uniref:uncharacterized protein isoform X1 n=1 Tax=Paralichthys olivaceus TaxID=8255 RepID=UPI0037523CD1